MHSRAAEAVEKQHFFFKRGRTVRKGKIRAALGGGKLRRSVADDADDSPCTRRGCQHKFVPVARHGAKQRIEPCGAVAVDGKLYARLSVVYDVVFLLRAVENKEIIAHRGVVSEHKRGVAVLCKSLEALRKEIRRKGIFDVYRFSVRIAENNRGVGAVNSRDKATAAVGEAYVRASLAAPVNRGKAELFSLLGQAVFKLRELRDELPFFGVLVYPHGKQTHLQSERNKTVRRVFRLVSVPIIVNNRNRIGVAAFQKRTLAEAVAFESVDGAAVVNGVFRKSVVGNDKGRRPLRFVIKIAVKRSQQLLVFDIFGVGGKPIRRKVINFSVLVIGVFARNNPLPTSVCHAYLNRRRPTVEYSQLYGKAAARVFFRPDSVVFGKSARFCRHVETAENIFSVKVHTDEAEIIYFSVNHDVIAVLAIINVIHLPTLRTLAVIRLAEAVRVKIRFGSVQILDCIFAARIVRKVKHGYRHNVSRSRPALLLSETAKEAHLSVAIGIGHLDFLTRRRVCAREQEGLRVGKIRRSAEAVEDYHRVRNAAVVVIIRALIAVAHHKHVLSVRLFDAEAESNALGRKLINRRRHSRIAPLCRRSVFGRVKGCVKPVQRNCRFSRGRSVNLRERKRHIAVEIREAFAVRVHSAFERPPVRDFKLEQAGVGVVRTRFFAQHGTFEHRL